MRDSDEIRLRLIEQTRLQDEEVDSYLTKAVDVGYWRKLIPHLSIGGDSKPERVEKSSIGSLRQRELLEGLTREGYFQTGPLLSAAVLGQMRECVEILKANGWPSIFAFIYDQFWLVWRAPSLVQLLSVALGPGYKVIPHMWCYYVHPIRGASGWPPHADGLGMLKRLTVWIPLSDATLDNGCMYVIPKDLLPEGMSDGVCNSKPVTSEGVAHLLQSSRALPAQAGSFLGWDFNVIHWGSVCHKVAEPRISISLEFIGEHTEPADDEMPVFDLQSTLPTFVQRLHIIGKGILLYHDREVRMLRYVELAERMVKDMEIVSAHLW